MLNVENVMLKDRVHIHFSWFLNVFYVSFYRYCPTGNPKKPECGHSSKAYQCSSLRVSDINKFHLAFYDRPDKQIQDAFILKNVEPLPVKRRRSVGQREPKTMSVKYFIQTPSKKVPVCRQVFLDILGITKHRVNTVVKNFKIDGTIPKEKRGGDRKSRLYENKRNAVIAFIKSFKCIESHYCRSKTSVRHYLSSELNIKKMWRMYNENREESTRVTHTFFRMIFNTRFNIGFGSPQTDVCSKCLELKERIKTANTNNQEKQRLMMEHTLHKKRASSFFSLLKEKREDLLTLSFDCQKNFALPKIPDQTVYYSRQLYLYNFTIVQGSSKDPLAQNNVFIYTWGEHEYPKGSNEIASALFHRLCNTDFDGITVLRCVADGCGGQNKNTTMMFMLQYWLTRHAPKNLKKIEVIFPIPGHSFIPPDRVFAQIEKRLKRIETLVDPAAHESILAESGTVFKPGRDYTDHDWKQASNVFIKPPSQWHFKFAPTKRFFITKNKDKPLVQGEVFYRNELGARKSVVTSKRNIMSSRLGAVATGTVIKPLKLRDVKNLLTKHYGPDWDKDDRLIFYRNILADLGGNEEVDEERDDESLENNDVIMCEPEDDDLAPRV